MALIITTVTSLIVAAVMSVIAWRLARDERRRSEARVATLAADILGERPSPVHVSDRFFAAGIDGLFSDWTSTAVAARHAWASVGPND